MNSILSNGIGHDAASAAPVNVSGPLSGLRVLELGHFVAAPFATRILADLGAEIIKIEPPGGDPAREMGTTVDGRSLWWSVHARNKKCVTLDLKRPEGRAMLLKLVESADALVENFRPGQLERWSLGMDVLTAVRPDLIVVRISGFGQNGPYRDRVAFGVIGEALGGIRYLTGYPKAQADLPPVRVGVSFGDSVAGLYGVIGLLAALYERNKQGTAVRGRCIDVALYEAVFSLMEGALPEYGRLGLIREPAGAAIPTVSPSSTYRCRDAEWICIAANSDRIFTRLMQLIGRPELAEDERFKNNQNRLLHRALLDEIIADWVAQQDSREVERLLGENDVPSSRIYTIADIARDPHFAARGMINEVHDPMLGALLHPGIVPKFADSGPAGGIGWSGPDVGAHNEEVFKELIGLSEREIVELKRERVI